MSDDEFDFFGGYEENDSTEAISTEVNSTETESTEVNRSVVDVERINAEEDGPFDLRKVKYPGFFGGTTYHSPPQYEEEKRKVGYYLRNSVTERLDGFSSYLDEHTEIDFSKSRVVESALCLFLRQWELHEEESVSMRWLLFLMQEQGQ